MVVDYLIKRQNGDGIFAQGYSGDQAVVVFGKFESTLGDVMRMTGGWCLESGLKVNPGKTGLILFGAHLIDKVRIFRKDLTMANEISRSYLGFEIELDSACQG